MTTEPTTRLEVHVASVGDMRGDLEKLRKRFGISYSRMKEVEGLPTAQVVSVELRRARRPEADRPYVTFDLLACTIRNRSVIPAHFGVVLELTLGLSQQRVELGERRRLACARLVKEFGEPDTPDRPLGPESERYQNIESEAYTFLAARFAGLSSNPCDNSFDLDTHAKVIAQLTLLDASSSRDDRRISRLEKVLNEFAKIVSSIARATASKTQYDLCDALLALFPRAKIHAVGTRGFASSLDAVTYLARGATETYMALWVPYVSFAVVYPNGRKYDKHRSTFASHFPEATKVDLYFRIVGRGDAPGDIAVFEELTENLAATTNSPGVVAPESELLADMSDYLTARSTIEDSLLLLAAIFWTLEATDDWASIDPPIRRRRDASTPQIPTL